MTPIKGEVALPTPTNPLPPAVNGPLCASLLAGAYSLDRIARGELTVTDAPALRGLMQTMVERSQPAAPSAITANLERLFAHYPQAPLTDSQLQGRWADWLDDLATIPPLILAAACRDWRRSPAAYAPTPGQFLEKAEPYFAAWGFIQKAASLALTNLEREPELRRVK